MSNDLIAQDKIFWKGKEEPTECKVIGETYKEVIYKIGRMELHSPIDNVKEIRYGYTPSDYSMALKLIEEDKYESAIKRLDQALERIRQTKRGLWIYQYALFEKARALKLLGKLGSALETFQTLKSKVPKTRLLKELYLEIYECYKLQEDIQKMGATLKEFEADPAFKDMNGLWGPHLNLLKADLSETKGDYRTAYNLYTKLSHSEEEILEAALLGELRSLAGLKETEKLMLRAKELAASKYSPKVKTAAHNSLGDLLYGERDYKGAMLEYLKGVLLYRPEFTPEHEYALSRTILCMIEYAKLNKAQREVYRGRALRHFAELRRLYPSSPWIQSLKEGLQKLE
jgi:tetratricopeptide (TPR) repeat protein